MAEREFAGTDRFGIKRRLGQGGMGVVYEAHDRVRGTSVALKTLTRFDAQAIYRMKQEFRALIDVSHPNLAQLYELVSANEDWFFTMELVDGFDFLTFVKSGGDNQAEEVPRLAASIDPVPTTSSIVGDTFVRPTEPMDDGDWGGSPAERFSITATQPTLSSITAPMLEQMAKEDDAAPRKRKTSIPHGLAPSGISRLRAAVRQLAEGMIALHDAGKLHRDIKPSNVMVTRAGRVVILDFGLVTEMYERWLIQSTMDGRLCGTVAYMAPEQALGTPLDQACDWYSVGVMLFEALTGCLPFEGKLFEILLAKQEREAPSIREMVPGVPADLERLCSDLLARDPKKRPTGREVLKRLGGVVSESIVPHVSWKSPANASKLVGRMRELSMLARAFDSVQRGGTVILHVHGKTGIGKTALVREFVESLSEAGAALVLSGRCFERELVPYKALDNVIDALSHQLRRLSKQEAQELRGIDVRALVRMFPVLKRVDVVRDLLNAATSTTIADPHQLRRKAVGALRDLIAALAKKKPLVIAIDDLHWGDEDSALLLADLLRPPYVPEMLLIAVYRTDERDSAPAVRALRADPGSPVEGLDVREIALGPLDALEAKALARAILAHAAEDETTDSRIRAHQTGGGTDPEIKANAIARESRGNPFLVHELASFAYETRHLLSEDSKEMEIKLERAIESRLRELPADARKLVEIIAVAGRPIRESLAFAATGIAAGDRAPIAVLSSNRLVRGIHSATREQLLEPYHQGMGEAVRGMLRHEELRARHAAIAAAIEAEPTPDPESLVHHLRAAGERRRAAEQAVLAAENAFHVLAFDRAAGLYRLAIELAPETSKSERELYSALGDALVNAGRARDGAEAYLKAAESADKEQGHLLRRQAAEQLLRSGHFDRGEALLRQVLAEVGAHYPETPQSAVRRIKLERAKMLLGGFKLPPIPEKDEPPKLEDARLADTLWGAAIGMGMIDFTRAVYFQMQNLRVAIKTKDRYRMVRALALEAALAAGEGQRDRTERILDHLDKLIQGLDSPHALGLAMMAKSWASYFDGKFRTAASLAERAIAILGIECSGMGWELDTARVILYSSLAYLGEISTLPNRIREDTRQARLRDNLYAGIVLQSSPSVGVVWLAFDRVDFARGELEAQLSQWPQRSDNLLFQHVQAILSEVFFDLYQGEGARAYRRVRQEWTKVQSSLTMRLRVMMVESHFARGCAALAAARQTRQGQNRLLRVARVDAKRLLSVGSGWTRAFGLLVEAGTLNLEGDRSRAVERLAEAAELFEHQELMLYRAVAVRARGELIGGDEGRAMVDRADTWLKARAVVDPERFTRALAPIDPRD